MAIELAVNVGPWAGAAAWDEAAAETPATARIAAAEAAGRRRA
jgi:hypothetical protein